MSSGVIGMLSPRVADLVAERGWTRLTRAQEEAIPAILRGANVLIMAPTGAGKTEAALLPVLSMMESLGSVEPVSLLYVTPMKALINDLYKRIRWWAQRLGLRVSRKHGDTPASERSRRLRLTPHILITTPESLKIDLDWSPRFRVYLHNLRWVIVDEVHELMSSKRGAQLALLLERLQRLAGRDLQRIGLSATIGDPERALEALSGSSRRPRVVVNAMEERRTRLRVRYIREGVRRPWIDSARVVMEEIEPPSLVFVNSRYTAEKLREALEALGVDDVFVHHSSVSAELRHEAEERLKRGELKAIVCTKTLELGIDVGQVRKVIQYRAPGSVASLLQRVGRSGHVVGGISEGAIVALGPIDFLEALAEARLAVEGRVEATTIARAPLDVVAKEILGAALAASRGEDSGWIDLNAVYDYLKSTPLTSYLSHEEFRRLVEYLEYRGLLRVDWPRARLGPAFFRVWRFRSHSGERAWWGREFSEFFSTIPSRDSFTVKHGDRVVGYVDSAFVYRYLRAGDAIRLAGRAWIVRRIDERALKVEVEPAEAIAEVPLWRGEGPRRHRMVAVEAGRVLADLDAGPVVVDEEGLADLAKLAEGYRARGLPLPSWDTVIYDNYEGEHVFTALLGSGASEALAMVLTYLASKAVGLNVHYRSTFYGFSVKAPQVDVTEMLLDLDPERFWDLVWQAIERSPLFYQVLREIQVDFGILGSADPEEDSIVYEEAKRQVVEYYLDLETAEEFLRGLKRGEIKIVKSRGPGVSPLAAEILESPPIRPWLPDLAGRIARLLEDNALTVMEIADILDLSEKTVENKLLEMRKPEYGDERVAAFIDIDEGEIRWTLARSLEYIASSEEFSTSFQPENPREPLRVTIKAGKGDKGHEIIVTPKALRDKWDELKRLLPEEVYMARVESAYSMGGREEPRVTIYHASRESLRWLLLNAAKYIETRLSSLY
ncbi:MAG: DEAD/DEAH box helicase [Desulfurococcales archaeon]|nr:DEAD/DEAH box helicase [Desulfurococcales archaeon]